MSAYDAIVVGSGPNGLAAAVALQRGGRRTLLFEANETLGGGTRTEELTLPGFKHDICSAVHPLAIASPWFGELGLERFGLEWLLPPAQAAQTLGSNGAVLLHSSVEKTALALDPVDQSKYRRLMEPLVRHWPELFSEILRPTFHFPKHPFLLGRFGLSAVWPAEHTIARTFRGPRARALFAGIAAHANAPLDTAGTAAIGFMLNLAGHARGWPIPKGGANKIAASLAALFTSLGGEIRTGERIASLKQLPPAKWTFFDLTPRQIAAICSDQLGPRHRRQMENYVYGPGVFKMDWALSGPIPWRAEDLLQSATVHVGANHEEILFSEKEIGEGRLPEKPYVLLSQPTLFDPTRAPTGQHVAWAYCHVPHGSTVDMSLAIENQIERFAPGFRDLVLAKHSFSPLAMEAKNANLIGGDISGGALNLRSLLFRPSMRLNPYRLPMANTYICSSSTPPGPGVHGMCGYNAVLSSGALD